MLERIEFGNTGLMVSKVAFGGIPIMRLSCEDGARLVRNVVSMGVNFIDTANMYGDSEEKIGAGLRDAALPRKDLVIASKSMARDRETFLEHIDLSLARLNTDYIDLYQLHGVSSDEAMDQVMGPGGAMEGLEQAIKEKKVRFPAFSSHNLSIAEKMMRTGRFRVLQIPFNFVDNAAADEILPLAREMNLGFMCMKPLGGGLLSDANLCFRYLMQFEGIVPDPGIENIEELREIVGIVENPRPPLPRELRRMEEIRREMGDTWCHRCDYCQPCPEGIPISLILVTESVVKRMSPDNSIAFLTPAMEKVKGCTRCGACAERCPYDLQIPDLLQRYHIAWERFVETKRWT
jgi:predicted aldo/keto reductase-like oxidoreductase